MAVEDGKNMSGGVKLVTDFAPLLAFFVSYRLYGLGVATAVLVGLTAVALAVVYALEKRVALMPLFSGLAVGIMGGLTLLFDDESFIKLKPTVVSILFSGILLGGLARGKLVVKELFGQGMQLTDKGWEILSLRWGLFFLCLAAANECVWRNFPTDTWVTFKVFGLFGMTIVFTAAQMPLIKRHWVEEPPQS